MNPKKDIKIAVIGLGYVGFPLACLFARKYSVIGFDLKEERVNELNSGEDSTLEVDKKIIATALSNGMCCTCNKEDLCDCNVYVVAVPTPVNERNLPDLKPLEKASRLVGEVMSEGDIVIYESTVYPGTTEEFCAPILEEVSGLKLNESYYLGYSPDLNNPGD